MILEIQSLKKTYAQGQSQIHVLKDLNFNLKEGETVAILGPSGSGKSTLISLIAGLDKPTAGNIQFLGERMQDKSESELTQLRAKNIGIVFQQYHLLPYLNALENVALPLELQGVEKTLAYEKAHSLLGLVGLESRISHRPHQLSGGENQRVAIARALVTSPKLLIADEPSGSLDNATGEIVMNCLFDSVARTHAALLLVTHNADLAKRCDRIVQLSNGQLQPQSGH